MEMIDFVHIPKNAGTSMKELCIPNLPSSFLSYHGHSADPLALKGEQLIILREPKDRFCSAVRYSLSYMKNDSDGDVDKFYEFEEKDLLDPSTWAEALADTNHLHHELVCSEVKNVSHKVGNIHLDDKWTYASQFIWLNRCCCPRVALFHELSGDLQYLFDSVNNSVEFNIPHENAVPSIGNNDLSSIAHEYLNDKYQEDIVIFNKYNTLHRTTRMSCQKSS
jgi:hypothetical protein